MNILREKSNLDNLYHTLKDCYLNQGYMVKYNDVKGQLELYLSDESKVSLIIKLQNLIICVYIFDFLENIIIYHLI